MLGTQRFVLDDVRQRSHGANPYLAPPLGQRAQRLRARGSRAAHGGREVRGEQGAPAQFSRVLRGQQSLRILGKPLPGQRRQHAEGKASATEQERRRDSPEVTHETARNSRRTGTNGRFSFCPMAGSTLRQAAGSPPSSAATVARACAGCELAPLNSARRSAATSSGRRSPVKTSRARPSLASPRR